MTQSQSYFIHLQSKCEPENCPFCQEQDTRVMQMITEARFELAHQDLQPIDNLPE